MDDGYTNGRITFNYTNRIIQLLSEIASGCESIIDVGSREVDVISMLPLKTKVSIDLTRPLVAKGIESITGDFFKYRLNRLFDIVCCFQTLEHINEVDRFTDKLFELSKKYVFISVPYKWNKGDCKYHVQDPVDERKLMTWTKRSPIFKEIVTDGRKERIICIYIK